MTHDFSELFSNLKQHVAETGEWLQRELAGVRTGRATPALLDSVRVETYGARTPITQIASISVEDARTIRIVPWDTSVSKDVEKAITEADLGVSVMIDDKGLRVVFPELTAERRAMLSKLVGDRLEQARVTQRGHRADAIKKLEGAEKEGGVGKDELARFKENVQKEIDGGSTNLDAIAKKKQDEIAQ